MTEDLRSMRSARAVEGGATRKQLRGPTFENAMHGVVRPAGLELDPLTAPLWDAAALLTRSTAMGGWASLWTQGNHWFDGVDRRVEERDILIHCLTGSQLRVRRGIRPSEGVVLAEELTSLGGHNVTTMARAGYDEMRMADNVREAVVVLDMATSTTSQVAHTTIDAIHRVVGSHTKTRGIEQARLALVLGDSRSASPWETRTRLLAQIDAGIVDLRVNVPVFDLAENLLGTADLLDPRGGLVIESDGGDHRELERHTDDNIREEKLERSGLVVTRVTSLDHRRRWATVQRIVAAQLDAERSSDRSWTIQKPGWWSSWAPARRWD